MTPNPSLTPQDDAQLAARGITRAEAERQLRLLAAPPRFAHLDRPCTVGDGLLALGRGGLARLEPVREERGGARGDALDVEAHGHTGGDGPRGAPRAGPAAAGGTGA